MDERGSGIAAACAHLVDAIALLDRLGEDAEAAHVSLSLERLASRHGVTLPAAPPRD